MAPLLGYTRSRRGPHHLLITTDAQTPVLAAGFPKVKVISLASPALGASFVELILLFEQEEGTAAFLESDLETFIYILEGSCTVDAGPAQVKRMAAGGYLFIPSRHACTLSGPEKNSRVLVFQRKYKEAPEIAPPRMIVGRSGQIQAQPYGGDPDARVQPFLPDEPTFDMAVSLFTLQPGASLPQVAVHGAEHGILLTQGQGIARVEDSWYPVKEGDALWIGAYAPQWFVATGKTPLQFLFFRESNRLPTLA